MSHLVQMVGLAVQNFVSAAVGMCHRRRAHPRPRPPRRGRTLGNFWVDLTRTTVRILLPISFVIAVVLVGQGVVQNFTHATTATTVDKTVQVQATDASGSDRRPARHRAEDPRRPGGQPGGDQGPRHQRRRLLQRQLGSPVREPEPGSRTSSRSSPCLLIRFAFPITFGEMVGSKRQGRVVLAVMGVLLADDVAAWPACSSRTATSSCRRPRGRPVDLGRPGRRQHGGQGGPLRCRLLRACSPASTTGTSTGSVNSGHDSFTPLGGHDPARQHEARRGLARRHRRRARSGC